MVKPLSFKGDKSSKKRKRQEGDDRNQALSTAKFADAPATTEGGDTQEDESELSWVSAEAPTDIAGPVLLTLPTSPPSCLACDANGKVFASELENLVSEDPTTAEPHDVRQVWVANRVAGTENFSWKGHHGRYLSCDKFGILSATKEAISSDESFLCILAPDTAAAFALQTQRDTFITVNEDKDVSSASIRGDADAIQFNSTLRIRMQARFKPKLKANKAEKAREKISRKELEEAVGRRLDDDEVKSLKRARKQGNYHEALLDVKVKGKHDKFA